MISNNHPGTQIVHKLGFASGSVSSRGPFAAATSEGSLLIFNRDGAMGEGPVNEQTLTLFWPPPEAPNDAGVGGGPKIVFRSHDPFGLEYDQGYIKASYLTFPAGTPTSEITIGVDSVKNVRFHNSYSRFEAGVGFYGLGMNPEDPGCIVLSDKEWDSTAVGSAGDVATILWKFQYANATRGNFGRIECVTQGDNLKPSGSVFNIVPYNSNNGGQIWSFHGISGTFQFPDGGAGRPTLSGSGMTIVASGSLEITGTGEGLVLRAPNNTRWRLTVDNSGTISTTSF